MRGQVLRLYRVSIAKGEHAATRAKGYWGDYACVGVTTLGLVGDGVRGLRV